MTAHTWQAIACLALALLFGARAVLQWRDLYRCPCILADDRDAACPCDHCEHDTGVMLACGVVALAALIGGAYVLVA